MATHQHILLIESDPDRQHSVPAELEKHEYQVDVCPSMAMLDQFLQDRIYELVILSIIPASLQVGSYEPMAVIEKLRSNHITTQSIPIILLLDPHQYDFSDVDDYLKWNFICPFPMVNDGRLLALKCKAAQNYKDLLPTIKMPDNLQEAIINMAKLSRREDEIMNLIGEGLSNKEISNVLTLSEHSVRTHIYNIFTKLNIKRRSQAVLLDIYRKQTFAAGPSVLTGSSS